MVGQATILILGTRGIVIPRWDTSEMITVGTIAGKSTPVIRESSDVAFMKHQRGIVELYYRDSRLVEPPAESYSTRP